MARRALQGHVIRSPHDEWTSNIAATVAELEALARSSGTPLGSHLRKLRDNKWPCYTPFAPIFDNPVSDFVCDAVVAYWQSSGILDAIYEFRDQFNFWKRDSHPAYKPSFLIFLAACCAGEIPLVQQALNDGRIFNDDAKCHALISSCLTVVAARGHTHVTQFLLDAGYDANHVHHGTCAVRKAAWMGNHDLLKLLLHPKYGLKRSGEQYRCAIFDAIESDNGVSRVENVKTLYSAAEGLDEPTTRKELFFRACQKDDMAFASWMLTGEPINMYSPVPSLTTSRTQFTLQWLAENGKRDWVRWLLQEQPPRLSSNRRHGIVFERALVSAAYMRHAETFFEMVRYFKWPYKRLWILAACVKDGLSRLNSCLPSPKLQATLSSKFPNSWGPEMTIGAEALARAITWGEASNVQWLLERGIRTHRSAKVSQDWYEQQRTVFSHIEAMLIDNGIPKFTIFDGLSIYGGGEQFLVGHVCN